MSDGRERQADERELRRTAELYAQGADRRDAALWSSLFTVDCVIEAPDHLSVAGGANFPRL